MQLALKNLKATYQTGRVKLSWQVPIGAPDTVHIFRVARQAEVLELDYNFHLDPLLRDVVNGCEFECPQSITGGVSKMSFCVYLSEHTDVKPNLPLLQSSPDFFVSVTAGSARVSYYMPPKRINSQLVSYTLMLESDADIDVGVLGYCYFFNGMRIEVDFPGRINRGLTVYEPVFLPENSNPQIFLIDQNTINIFIQTKKFSRWRLFKAK